MLKKIVRDILIVFGLLVTGLSIYLPFMEFVHDNRAENDSWWGIHKPVKGDLVGMAYLDEVPKFHSERDYAFIKHPVETGKIDLYVWGDSYIWKIPDTAYAAVDHFKFGWRYRDDIAYNLYKHQKNILLIEISERYVRPYLSGTDIFNHVYHENADKQAISRAYIENEEEGLNTPGFLNKHINQNLEFNLFNYNFINPIRQAKATMNYHLFGRASGNVEISKDGQQLYLKETVSGKAKENSYYPVDDNELRHMITVLNTIYDHYRDEGFDEVYLSMIPNPATILQRKNYNQLIPRLENSPNMKMRIISIFTQYQKENRRIYHPGDTHWNNNGLQIWLKEVNRMLIEQNAS